MTFIPTPLDNHLATFVGLTVPDVSDEYSDAASVHFKAVLPPRLPSWHAVLLLFCACGLQCSLLNLLDVATLRGF